MQQEADEIEQTNVILKNDVEKAEKLNDELKADIQVVNLFYNSTLMSRAGMARGEVESVIPPKDGKTTACEELKAHEYFEKL